MDYTRDYKYLTANVIHVLFFKIFKTKTYRFALLGSDINARENGNF
jgi:hypothetical protein